MISSFFLIISGPPRADPADWSVVPAVTAKTEYESNLNFGFTNKIGDYIFSISPVAEFHYNTDETQLKGYVGLNGLAYVDHPQIDTIDQNYYIDGRQQLTPRLSLLMKGAYSVDNTLQEELNASGLIIGRTGRQFIEASPGFKYALTERLTATMGYDFNRCALPGPRLYQLHHESDDTAL